MSSTDFLRLRRSCRLPRAARRLARADPSFTVLPITFMNAALLLLSVTLLPFYCQIGSRFYRFDAMPQMLRQARSACTHTHRRMACACACICACHGQCSSLRAASHAAIACSSPPPPICTRRLPRQRGDAARLPRRLGGRGGVERRLERRLERRRERLKRSTFLSTCSARGFYTFGAACGGFHRFDLKLVISLCIYQFTLKLPHFTLLPTSTLCFVAVCALSDSRGTHRTIDP